MPDSLELVSFAPFLLVAAYLADLLFGDPERLPHPVRLIGRAVSALESVLLPLSSTAKGKRLAGIVLVLFIVGGTWATVTALLYLSHEYSLPLFYALSAYVVWTSLCIGSLKKEAGSVVDAFEKKGLIEARARLSRIVGRDTNGLSEEGVMRATVETVAENSSDGIVAPLFYLAIGGPALMMAYKAINTLDSMVGYKNDRYIDFGWAGARLDDAANLIPSRITGLLVALSAFFLRYNGIGSLRVMFRDGNKHPSPNSGVSEAAMSGALGIRLGGPSHYGGRLSEKPHIGQEGDKASAQGVRASIRVMSLTAFLMVAIVYTVRACFFIP